MSILSTGRDNVLLNPWVSTIVGAVAGFVSRVSNRIPANKIIGSDIVQKIVENGSKANLADKTADVLANSQTPSPVVQAFDNIVVENGGKIAQKAADLIVNDAASTVIDDVSEIASQKFEELFQLAGNAGGDVQASLTSLTEVIQERLASSAGGSQLAVVSESLFATLGSGPSGGTVENAQTALQTIVDIAANLPEGTSPEVAEAAQAAALNAQKVLDLLLGDNTTAEAMQSALTALTEAQQHLGTVGNALLQAKENIAAFSLTGWVSQKIGTLQNVCALDGNLFGIPIAIATAVAIGSFRSHNKMPGHAAAVARTLAFAVASVFGSWGKLTNLMLQGAALYSSYRAAKLAGQEGISKITAAATFALTAFSAWYAYNTTYFCQQAPETVAQLGTGIAATVVIVSVAKILELAARKITHVVDSNRQLKAEQDQLKAEQDQLKAEQERSFREWEMLPELPEHFKYFGDLLESNRKTFRHTVWGSHYKIEVSDVEEGSNMEYPEIPEYGREWQKSNYAVKKIDHIDCCSRMKKTTNFYPEYYPIKVTITPIKKLRS